MKQTGEAKYNEVTLAGTSKNGTVQVVGFWIKIDQHGQPIDSEIAGKIQRLAYIHNFPLIRIKEFVKTYEDDKPELFQEILDKVCWGCGVNRNNLRYVFDFKRGKYFVLENMNKGRAMTMEEYDQALSLFNSEFTDVQKDKVGQLLANSREQFLQSLHKKL